MKRLIVLPIILLVLNGCSKIESAKPITENISFVAAINYDDTQYVCKVDIYKNALDLVVVEPEEISGLILKINKNEITTEYNGITHTRDLSQLPQNSVSQILFNIINDIKEKTIDFNLDNGVIIGEVNDYKYEFTFSPSGLPLSLSIDDLDLEVIFSKVVIKQES